MRHVNIKQKLVEMGVALDSVVMGDFDFIGEFTAKRDRHPNDPNYKRFGAFYRSNYERGILIYYLIRQHGLSSMLEIGFGSAIRREWQWRVKRGEPLDNLRAFEAFVQRTS